MAAFDHVLDTARRTPRRVVLPESTDARVLKAAVSSYQQGIAQPVLLGNASALQDSARKLDVSLDGIETLDPATCTQRQHYRDSLVRRRGHRGMTPERAEAALDNPVTFACVMVREGDADACVAGAITATAEVVRNARRYVGKHPGAALVSSCFIMLLREEHPVDEVMLIGDCALVVDPDSEQLAHIALSTATTAHQLLGMTPEIALLSFSTSGSARHSTVSKVSQASTLARQRCSPWRVVGEVQLDAAVIPAILQHKSPEQAGPNPCNVLIFPNLDAGNIGYKLIERFGGAQAVGPIMQGLRKPVNDLSRGCSSQDIVNIIAVSAAQVATAT